MMHRRTGSPPKYPAGTVAIDIGGGTTTAGGGRGGGGSSHGATKRGGLLYKTLFLLLVVVFVVLYLTTSGGGGGGLTDSSRAPPVHAAGHHDEERAKGKDGEKKKTSPGGAGEKLLNFDEAASQETPAPPSTGTTAVSDPLTNKEGKGKVPFQMRDQRKYSTELKNAISCVKRTLQDKHPFLAAVGGDKALYKIRKFFNLQRQNNVEEIERLMLSPEVAAVMAGPSNVDPLNDPAANPDKAGTGVPLATAPIALSLTGCDLGLVKDPQELKYLWGSPPPSALGQAPSVAGLEGAGQQQQTEEASPIAVGEGEGEPLQHWSDSELLMAIADVLLKRINDGERIKSNVQGAQDDVLAEGELSSEVTPAEFFTAVGTLDLGANQLESTTLPSYLSSLFPKLHTLFFTGNLFTTIPSAVLNFAGLTRLSFKQNKLTAIRSSTELPPTLIHLILTENQIISTPSLSFCQGFPALRKLMLSGNQLTDIASVLQPQPQPEPEPQQQAEDRGGESAAAVNVGGGGGGGGGTGECQLRSLELVRLCRNRITQVAPGPSPASADGPNTNMNGIMGNILRGLPRLSWLSFSGNPIVGAVPDISVAEAVKRAIKTLPDMTDAVTCVSKSSGQLKRVGAGASGRVLQCTTGDAEELDFSEVREEASIQPIIALEENSGANNDVQQQQQQQFEAPEGEGARGPSQEAAQQDGIPRGSSTSGSVSTEGMTAEPPAELTQAPPEEPRDVRARTHNKVAVKFFKPLSSDGGAADELRVLDHLPSDAPTLLAALGVVKTDRILEPFTKNDEQQTKAELTKVQLAAVFPFIEGYLLGIPPGIETVSDDLFYPVSDPGAVGGGGGGGGVAPGAQQLIGKDTTATNGAKTLKTIFPTSKSVSSPRRSPSFAGEKTPQQKVLHCLPVGAIGDIALDIAQAMVVMHDHNVIHGDLYAHNIFLAKDSSSGGERRHLDQTRSGLYRRGIVTDFGASFHIPTAASAADTGAKEFIDGIEELKAIDVRAFGTFVRDLVKYLICPGLDELGGAMEGTVDSTANVGGQQDQQPQQGEGRAQAGGGDSSSVVREKERQLATDLKQKVVDPAWSDIGQRPSFSVLQETLQTLMTAYHTEGLEPF